MMRFLRLLYREQLEVVGAGLQVLNSAQMATHAEWRIAYEIQAGDRYCPKKDFRRLRESSGHLLSQDSGGGTILQATV